jgi:hypothetical protein
MSIAKVLHGVTYNIPETKEKSWGPTVTPLFSQIIDDLNGLSVPIGGIPQFLFQSTSTSLAAGSTLTQTHPWHRISGTPGAVTLSASMAIADGAAPGILLVLTGGINPVTILDAANTFMNGNCTLSSGDALALLWDATNSYWWELWRNS